MKRLLPLLVLLCLLACSIPCHAAAGFANFRDVTEYREGQFADVHANDWFAENIAAAYRMGLLKGRSETQFDVNGYVTWAEATTMVARIHKLYHQGSAYFIPSEPWYQSYLDYAMDNHLLYYNRTDYSAKVDLNSRIDRSDFACIMTNALPEEALPEINAIPPRSIPDITPNAPCLYAVYTLYCAGITVGSDAKGTYHPADPIRRSEVAAIVTRMAVPSLRLSVTLKPSIAFSNAISVSQTSYVVDVHSKNSLTVHSPYADSTGLSRAQYKTDESILGCTWEGWYGDHFTFNFAALKPGHTTVELWITDWNGVRLSDSIKIDVTVKDISVSAYSDHPEAPDFGANFGIPLAKAAANQYGTLYSYKLSDMKNGDPDEYDYNKLLRACGYEFNSVLLAQNGLFYEEWCSDKGGYVYLGRGSVDGQSCYNVQIANKEIPIQGI